MLSRFLGRATTRVRLERAEADRLRELIQQREQASEALALIDIRSARVLEQIARDRGLDIRRIAAIETEGRRPHLVLGPPPPEASPPTG